MNLCHSHARQAITRLHAGGAMTHSYTNSWTLRLHRTSPVVGSERTCDDVELFKIDRVAVGSDRVVVQRLCETPRSCIRRAGILLSVQSHRRKDRSAARVPGRE